MGWLVEKFILKMVGWINDRTARREQTLDAFKNPSLELLDQQIAALQKSREDMARVHQNALTSGLLPGIFSPASPLTYVPPPEPEKPAEPAAAAAPEVQSEPQPGNTMPETSAAALQAAQTSAQAAAQSSSAPAPSPAPAAAPVDPQRFTPDVKMLAPVLKIALQVLSVEQMIEIGLHVKQGAPGFKQFLDSDVAKAEFSRLYAVYCDFLAGKVK